MSQRKLAAAVLGSVIAVAGPAWCAYAAPVPTPTAPIPQLSIAIDDGRIQTSAGDQLVYAITARNVGTTTATSLEIWATLPRGLTFHSADHGGVAKAGVVTWTITVKPGASIRLSTSGQVGPTGAQLLRLATVACAAQKANGPPLVCATDSDLLPAGAAALQPRARGNAVSWYVGAGVLLVAAAVGVLAYLRRRRRVRAGATAVEPSSPAPADARRSGRWSRRRPPPLARHDADQGQADDDRAAAGDDLHEDPARRAARRGQSGDRTR